MNVYYRGAMNKLRCIHVPDVVTPEAAIGWAWDEVGKDPFVKKPLLVRIEGGKR